MRIIVTGGAGYIGSHVVQLLKQRGDEVLVIDDFSTGVQARVRGCRVATIDISAPGAVAHIRLAAQKHSAEAVIHLAAKKSVEESVKRPVDYHVNNVGGLLNLLEAVKDTGIQSFVFSSSAAVYGESEGAQIVETAPAAPVNPYGRTKLIGENILADTANSTGLAAASLRYFNVAGSSRPDLAEFDGTNLVPLVLRRIEQGVPPLIFGDDYPTPDGTCVRDYIHVQDLAEAHIATLDGLRASSPGHRVYNVGTGVGTSVREMVDALLTASGAQLRARVIDARPGDPAYVVAATDKIERELGWRARFSLTDIVTSALKAAAPSAEPPARE
jgi:UDP-glucose 4-epimerase